MVQSEKADVTVVSDKGQVVIPQNIRKRLGIEPKTKLLVYGYEDAVIMTKLQVPDVAKELEAMYNRINKRIAKHGELPNKEINQAILGCRRKNKPAKAEGLVHRLRAPIERGFGGLRRIHLSGVFCPFLSY